MCGVGGSTIEQAKSNLTAEEVTSWWNYRVLRGPMNSNMRIDRIGALFVSTQTGKSMDNYMPWSKDPGKKQEEGLSAGSVEVAKHLPEGAVVDGMVVSHSRKVASKPATMLKSDMGRKVSATPNSKKHSILTLEQRRARLKNGK